jgi:hypothetical protein
MAARKKRENICNHGLSPPCSLPFIPSEPLIYGMELLTFRVGLHPTLI